MATVALKLRYSFVICSLLTGHATEINRHICEKNVVSVHDGRGKHPTSECGFWQRVKRVGNTALSCWTCDWRSQVQSQPLHCQTSHWHTFCLGNYLRLPNGGVQPLPQKLFDTPPTPAPIGGVKSSYTPDRVHVILSYKTTTVAQIRLL